MIKNVIFDLGGVLVKYDPWEYITTLGFEENRAKGLYDIIFHDRFWNDMDIGKYPSYIPVIDEVVNRHKEYENEIRYFFQDGWMQIYRLMKESEVFYNQILEAGYPIYILSNYSAEGFAYIEGLEQFRFLQKASGRIISSHVHKVKPDPDIYKLLLNKYNLNADECVFFDDKLENIQAAELLSIHGIQFTSLEDAQETFRKMIQN